MSKNNRISSSRAETYWEVSPEKTLTNWSQYIPKAYYYLALASSFPLYQHSPVIVMEGKSMFLISSLAFLHTDPLIDFS